MFYRKRAWDYPLIELGEGVYLYDKGERRYIDGTGGPMLVNIGHGVPQVAEPIARQAGQIEYVHGTQFTGTGCADGIAGDTMIISAPCIITEEELRGFAPIGMLESRHGGTGTAIFGSQCSSLPQFQYSGIISDSCRISETGLFNEVIEVMRESSSVEI